MRTLIFVPRVSGIEGFHCMSIKKSPYSNSNYLNSIVRKCHISTLFIMHSDLVVLVIYNLNITEASMQYKNH